MRKSTDALVDDTEESPCRLAAAGNKAIRLKRRAATRFPSRFYSFLKNASAMAPGPTCVPMVAPTEWTGSSARDIPPKARGCPQCIYATAYRPNRRNRGSIGMEKSTPPILLDLLGCEQVAAVLGSARLAHQMDLAVLNGNHGLDGKHLSHRAHRAGDSAAATQVLKGIEQADDNHAIARGLDGVGDLLSAKTPVHQLQRVLHQDVLANRNALRVRQCARAHRSARRR